MLIEPLLRLGMAAGGAVTIPTGPPHPVITPAAITVVSHVPQLTCATANDGREHLAMTDWDFFTETLQVAWHVLPQHIGNASH